MKTRETPLKYSSAKNSSLQRHKQNLEQKMSYLQTVIDDPNSSNKEKHDATEEYNKHKAEMENIVEYRTKGSILRLKTRWYNEGEKNSKYFLNLEKRHYNKGAINCLKTDEGKSLASDKEVLNECECFFRDLYKSNLNTESIPEKGPLFNKDNDTCLGDTQREACEGLLL